MSGVESEARPSARSRHLVDLAMAVAFVGVYAVWHSLTTAMLALAAVAASGTLLTFVRERRLARLPLVAAVGAGLTAGLALAFHDPGLIEIAVTVHHLVIGAALIAGLALNLNPLKIVFGQAFRLPDRTWTQLALRYALFVFGVAALNEVVRRTQSQAVWTVLRFPCLPILHALFVLSQIPTVAAGRRQIAAEDGRGGTGRSLSAPDATRAPALRD